MVVAALNGGRRRPRAISFSPIDMATTKIQQMQLYRHIKGQRQQMFWRSNTLPSFTRSKTGCFNKIGIYEENVRFVLLALLLFAYMCLGASIFSRLESDNEAAERLHYSKRLRLVLKKYCSFSMELRQRTIRTTAAVNVTTAGDGVELKCNDLLELLDLRGNMSASGYFYPRPRWDWSGSFYFVGTLISTIGFGMTTPRTNWGKCVAMLYGFIGCTCCILFFNLFLERVVTFYCYALRSIRRIKLGRRSGNRQQQQHEQGMSGEAPELTLNTQTSITIDYSAMESQRCSSFVSDVDGHIGGYSDNVSTIDEVQEWRPPVYKVFLCLFATAFLLVAFASLVYNRIERWSYIDSVYFSFISFTTIGFGDFVSSQQEIVEHPGSTTPITGASFWASSSSHWYRATNFIILTVGCCCVYSLLNVASVLIRYVLNGLIKKLDLLPVHSFAELKRRRRRTKHTRYLGLGLRPPKGSQRGSVVDEMVFGDERQQQSLNGEASSSSSKRLISLKEFLLLNQSSVLLVQRHIIGSSSKRRPSTESNDDSKIGANNAVGPLAILDQKFGVT